ncbi:cyclic nucleotide-binding domain-containing protein [Hymenobacter sp. BT175]|uniref:sensor histidine kinase n=1 Tax=Hymenobacter translucens TaxID=2886507 RepID=UPI001D0E4FD4|nr:ATP-binding protein [Hymenobacter translucens]MCC2545699.1 cyclic nucleotide-binding domain-containing protein [Hymenobacter translucens]
MSAPCPPAELAGIETFAGLPPETLTWLTEHGECRDLAPHEVMIQPGDPAEFLFAVLAGAIQFYSANKGNREPLFRVEAGKVSGVLPYSRLRVANNSGEALGPTRLYLLHRDKFAELERVSPELIQRLVGVMSDRARDEVRAQERDDKLRALGKLSAGLAHELNNPAAAISRAAESLQKLVTGKPAHLIELLQHCPDPPVLARLLGLAQTSSPVASVLSSLEQADQEDELADWLEIQGVSGGYQYATGLLAAGLTTDALAPVLTELPKSARPAAVAWLEAQLTTGRLLLDVQEASTRISTLVGNVKTYSHMDRAAGLELLDVHAGLDSTLNILGYALRQKNIQVVRDFGPDLPKVPGQVSSLNQVWTNLLDNAVDALSSGGELVLRTRHQGDFVCITIQDNGPGIPADVLPHIFEPFFTTKPAGSGSGLGLDIAQRIVRSHNGRLQVRSEPGQTAFSVWLPVSN